MFGVSHPGVFGTLFCFFLNRGRGSKGGEGLTMGTAWEVKEVGWETYCLRNCLRNRNFYRNILHSKRCLKVWVKFQTALQLQVSQKYVLQAQASKCYMDEWNPQHKDAFRSCMCRRHEQQWSALYQVNSCDTLQRESVKHKSFATAPIFLRIPPFKSFGY